MGELSVTEEDYVIAVDGGLSYCGLLHVEPDLIIGDCDSMTEQEKLAVEQLQQTVPEKICRLPECKDDTDMLAAIKRGLELGYRRFVLLGGLGGRLEHTLGNLQLLDWLSTQGAVGFLAGEKTVVTALRDGSLTFPPAMSGYLSVLCSSGTAHGVTLSNLKYPLTGYDMTSSFPIGVSNEFLPDRPAAVSVKDGCLLLIWEDKGDFYLRLPKLWARGEAL